MTPSFLTLFKRGKYYRQIHIASTQDSDEKVEGQVEQERKEAERFAVAAIAFCLEYDNEFKLFFLREICRLNESEVRAFATFEIEKRNWCDLTIVIRDVKTLVIEFKIDAELDAKQNPQRKEFLGQNGYGTAMVASKVKDYIVLGAKADLRLEGGKKVHDILCRQMDWDVFLKFKHRSNRMVGDLYGCIGSLGVTKFRLMKAQDICVRKGIVEGVKAMEVLESVANDLCLHAKYDWHADENGSWYFGIIIKQPKVNGKYSQGVTKTFAEIAGHPEGDSGWFGYTGSSQTKLTRSVWVYCIDEKTANAVSLANQESIGIVKTIERKDGNSGWDVEITSAPECSSTLSDVDWFLEVFRQIGATKR